MNASSIPKTPQQDSSFKLGLFQSIRHKLLFAFMAIIALLAISIASLSYYSARNALRAEAFSGLEALRETRSEQLLLWLQDRQQEAKLLAANPTVVIAANSLINSLEQSMNPQTTPVELIGEMVKNYRGQPKLQFAGDTSIYSSVHNRIHPFFQNILTTRNYADILLVSPSGNVVYTVQKRVDFGTNVRQGAHEALKELHHALMQAKQADVTGLTDMMMYEPANQPVMFVGTPIFNDKQLAGALILELPVTPVNAFLNLRKGMGSTGESYLVGQDHLFRSESRFSKELAADSVMLNPKFRVDTDAVRAAFKNNTGIQVMPGYLGKPVVSTWQPVVLQSPTETNPQGLAWALIVEKHQAEVEAPALKLLRAVTVVALAVSVIAFGVGYVLADRIARPIQHISLAARRLSRGDAVTLPLIASRDEIGALANDFQVLIDMTNETTRVAESIAKGNLEIEVRERSEDDRLMQALNRMIHTLKAMTKETDNLISAVQGGNTTIRNNAETYLGGWRELVAGINLVMDAFVAPLNLTAGYVARIANGDIPEKITDEYLGDFNIIKKNLNQCIDAITGLITETNRLTTTAVEGKLSVRGDVSRFRGDFAKIVQGINNTLDAVITPLSMAASHVERIANGDIPEKITDEYRGDFNIIKNNLNQCIDAITGLIAETNRLTTTSVEGHLSARGDVNRFQGDFARIVQGINNTLDAVITPLNMAASYVERIANGDIPEKITDNYQGDFNAIKQNINALIEAMHDITDLAEKMANGDLTVTVRERSDDDRLMQALNMMLKRLNDVVKHVKSVAANVAVGSQAISANATTASQGASEQAASAEQVSSSMEEMAANIRQTADNAVQTEKIAVQSANDAQESGLAVAETVRAMKEIAEKIAIIEDIAQQTRMLSLNATIEAARALDEGRAFGVVAAAVRSLSERSQIAAESINKLVGSSMEIAKRAGGMLSHLVPDIRMTASLVQEISASSREQNLGTEQINTAIQQLDQVIQQNAALSEQMSATSEELAIQAEQLQETMAFFHVDEANEKDGEIARAKREKKVFMPRDAVRHAASAKRQKANHRLKPHNRRVKADEPNSDERDNEFERF